MLDAEGELIRQLSQSEAARVLNQANHWSEESKRQFEQVLKACRSGVRRVHLLRRNLNGALLLELFTRDGVGTMLAGDSYEDLRAAHIDDVGGILALIRPLEQTGVLVRRSRERLEVEIDRFVVLERDGTIIGCAALYPFIEEQIGELACVVIHEDYRNSGRADMLLSYIEKQASRLGLQQLFVLTTQTAHWFRERGFEPTELHNLPVARQKLYNIQRRSKVFSKTI